MSCLDLDDRRVHWISRPLAAALRFPCAPYTGLEREHPAEVPVLLEHMRAPKACAGWVTLPPAAPLPTGAVDRARLALGKGGDWPCPQPGRFCSGGDDEEVEG